MNRSPEPALTELKTYLRIWKKIIKKLSNALKDDRTLNYNMQL